jgi:hypothetical protein
MKIVLKVLRNWQTFKTTPLKTDATVLFASFFVTLYSSNAVLRHCLGIAQHRRCSSLGESFGVAALLSLVTEIVHDLKRTSLLHADSDSYVYLNSYLGATKILKTLLYYAGFPFLTTFRYPNNA